MFRKAWGGAVWLFDWYLRLEWVGKLIIGLGVGVGLIGSVTTFFATVGQGLSPPLAIFAALFALLLIGLITLVVMEITGKRRSPRHIHHHNSTVQLRGTEARAETAAPSAGVWNGTAVPNWPIHDLFFHICPDVLENHKEMRWEKVGMDIKDRFSTGQLKVWGREIDPQTKRHSALVEVPTNYWAKAEFIYFFLEAGRENDAHTWTPANRPTRNDYADVRVNREEALAIWPEVKAVATPITTPPTLLDSYQNDFPGVGKHFEDTNLDDQAGFKTSFKTSLYTDHFAGSKFLAFYVPESADAYRTIETLPDVCTQLMDRIQSDVVIKSRMAGEIEATSGKDLRFTGFVYVYSPQDFSLQQMAALDALYTAKGMKLRLRGHAYQSANFLRWHADSAKA